MCFSFVFGVNLVLTLMVSSINPLLAWLVQGKRVVVFTLHVCLST